MSIKLWDLANYACVRTLRGHDHTISSVRFLAATATNGESPIEAAPSSKSGLEVAVTGASFLLSASRDATVKLWDLETGFCEHTYTDHNEWVRCLATRPGLWASAGNDHVIYVYDYTDPKVAAELRGHEHVVETLAFLTQDGRPHVTRPKRPQNADAVDYLVSGSRDRTVRLWRIASASCIAVFNAHENWVRSVLLHPSGQYVISSSDDKTIRVFDIKAQRCLRTLEGAHDHFVAAIDMHPTLPILVSASVDTTIRCWTLD
jgi:platelet-activating factor acetylhydrolase IB subunit alpha